MDKDNFYIPKGGFLEFNFNGKIEINNADESEFPDAIIIPRQYLTKINGGNLFISNDSISDEIDELN